MVTEKEMLNLWEKVLYAVGNEEVAAAEESVRAMFPEISQSISKKGADQLVVSTKDAFILEALAVLYYNALSEEAKQHLAEIAKNQDNLKSAICIGKMHSPNGEALPAPATAITAAAAETVKAGT